MDFKDFYIGLTEAERLKFASDAKTTVNYIESHLIHRSRVPRMPLIKNLCAASNGKLQQPSLILWFHKAAA